MGVGLNIAQKIIHENHSTITAYNEDNGAVFEIIL
jgi:C4-dicarboxylate-specific signal transduction histidine kinase